MQKQEFFTIARDSGLSTSQTEVLLCHILSISREELFGLQEIKARYLYPFQKYILEYKSGKPEAYILEKTTFLGRDFFVDPCTLIPRPETEKLVEVMRDIALKYADMKESMYLDIGTGTGCVGLSVCSELRPLRFAEVYLSDISEEIIDLAEKNRDALELGDIKCQIGSLLEPYMLQNFTHKKHLYITANLPYIRSGDTINVGESVTRFEPKTALYGGEKTGFELYEIFLKQCFQLKELHQFETLDLCIEIGFDQRQVSEEVLRSLGLQFEYFQDMAKIDRIIHIYAF